MKIEINIPEKRFNKLHELAGECEYPEHKIPAINAYVAQLLARLGVDVYDGLGSSDFYDWIAEKIQKKFKLKQYED